MAKGPIAHVEVTYAGGITASAQKLMRPLMRIFGAYAGKVKYRITKQGKLANGGQVGRYTKMTASREKAERELKIATRRGNFRAIGIWKSVLENIDLNRGGRRREYRRSGGLWKGLAVKAQSSGKKITMGFLSGSPGTDGKKVQNKKKAWY